MSAAARPRVEPIQNAQLVEHDCAWCDAIQGADVHSAYCPVGERAKHIQQNGGLGRCEWDHDRPSTTLEHA